MVLEHVIPDAGDEVTRKDSQEQKAEVFRALHHAKRLLVLPNAWDVASARVFEDAGFPAIATSSAALAASIGYPDGEKIPKEELFAIVKRIAGAVTIPVSVDIESGYGKSLDALEDTIRMLLATGAVGLNLEDTSRVRGRTLLPIAEQVERLRTVRHVSDAAGIPLVINARTDAFSLGKRDEETRYGDALTRARAYETAGPDCVYPMGLADPGSIATFVKAVQTPVNVMVRKGLPTVPELERMGVRRLSLGPTPMYATMGLLKRVAQELEERGTYDLLTSGVIGFDELMALAVPRRP